MISKHASIHMQEEYNHTIYMVVRTNLTKVHKKDACLFQPIEVAVAI